MIDGDDTIDHVTQLAAAVHGVEFVDAQFAVQPVGLFADLIHVLSCCSWDQDNPVAGIRAAVRVRCERRHIRNRVAGDFIIGLGKREMIDIAPRDARYTAPETALLLLSLDVAAAQTFMPAGGRDHSHIAFRTAWSWRWRKLVDAAHFED